MKAQPSFQFIPWQVGLCVCLGTAIIPPDNMTAAAGAADMASVRVLTTDQNHFEYLFAGIITSADGQSLLAFNHCNGRTSFVRTGDFLGPYRVADFEGKTNQVYMPLRPIRIYVILMVVLFNHRMWWCPPILKPFFPVQC